MSSNPPRPPPSSDGSLAHPTMRVETSGHLTRASGTFKGFLVEALFSTDWHGTCAVDWHVRDHAGNIPDCAELHELLEDLSQEISSLIHET